LAYFPPSERERWGKCDSNDAIPGFNDSRFKATRVNGSVAESANGAEAANEGRQGNCLVGG
jgi:hypothetical protein